MADGRPMSVSQTELYWWRPGVVEEEEQEEILGRTTR